MLLAGVLMALLLPWSGAPNRFEESPITVELEVAADPIFVHQRIPVRVRLRIPTSFLEEHLVQLFPQHLDVPVELRAPWLQGQEGLRVVTAPEPVEAGSPGRGAAQLVLNDQIVQAERREEAGADGASITVLDLSCVLRATEPGLLALQGTRLRYAHASRFAVDFFGDRVPEDRSDAEAAPDAVEFEVLPLPDANRPPDFSGAVGSLRVSATAEPRTLAAGDSLQLRVTIEGEGNLHDFAAPPMPALQGFAVVGMLDRREDDRRVFVYDVVLENPSQAELPALPFSFFDPGPPADYRTIHTAAIPLAVSGQPERTSDSRLHDLMPVLGDSGAATQTVLHPAVIALALAAPWLLAIWILRGTRRLRPVHADPRRAAAQVAHTRFQQELATAEPGQESAALARYLAARLGVNPAAVIAPDLVTRLVRAGAPVDLAEKTDRLLVQLTGMRYGGADVAGAADRCRQLVDALSVLPLALEVAR